MSEHLQSENRESEHLQSEHLESEHLESEHFAILLCAGYGTRMGELVATTPKPLLPVAGRPVLDYLLDQLTGLAGLDHVHLVTNSRHADAFRRWADARRTETHGAPLPITVHDDGTHTSSERLGAIGDLGFVLERTGLPAAALVAAGDNILRFSLRPFWESFRQDGTNRVLALHEPRLERLRRTGVLELAGDAVVGFWEKPAEPPSRWVCPPFYALGRSALERVGPYLAAGLPADEIGRLIAHLVEHEPVRATRMDGERLDIGSPESYRRADALLRREPVLRPGGPRTGDWRPVDGSATLDDSSESTHEDHSGSEGSPS